MAISTSVEVVDRVSGALNRITASLYSTTAAFGSVDRASEIAFNASGVQAMAQEVYAYEQRVQQLEADLVDANTRLEQMENNTQRAVQSANMLENAFGAVKGIIATIGVQKIFETSDGMTQIISRLNLMNDGAQSTSELFDMIYASAKNTHAPLMSTADAIARMGNNAGAAFNSNQELIAFMEQVNKQFVIGGASAQEQSNALLQLSQAMASGALRGDELNSILDAAPGIARSIEQNMGWAEGSIKSYAQEGAVTAEVVKNSLLNMANETNAAFESMPVTFSQVMTDFQSDAGKLFQPVLQRINDIAKSDGFQGFVNSTTTTMATVANATITIFDAVGAVGTFIADNWSIIEPIIMGIVIALGLYYGAMLLYNSVTAISTGITAAKAFGEQVHAAATMMQTGATFAATAAQYGFNAALLACPITWIIIGIIALIAAIYAIVAALNKATGSTYSATGIIAGAFSWLAACIVNTFVVPVQNKIASFVNFFGNVFNNPVAAVQVLFYDMALTVIGYIVSMASAIESVINKIPGVTVDITSGLDNFYSGLEKAQQAVKDESGWVEYVGKMDYIDANSWANAGYDFGSGLEDKVSSGIEGLTTALDTTGIDSAYTGTGAGSVADSLSNIAGDTSAISDSVDITDENLKYLRDIAERDVINRFTTAEIKVDMQNTNTINSNMDIDGIVDQLTTGVADAMAQAAEGVH